MEYTQAELECAAAELGAQGTYLGEWHSHLVADPQPSALDIESLTGISAAPHYLTRCLVMLIAGFDTACGAVEAMGAWVFPVGGRMYRIEYEIVEKT